MRPRALAVFRLMVSSNFVGLLHRQIGGSRPLQDPIDVLGGAGGADASERQHAISRDQQLVCYIVRAFPRVLLLWRDRRPSRRHLARSSYVQGAPCSSCAPTEPAIPSLYMLVVATLLLISLGLLDFASTFSAAFVAEPTIANKVSDFDGATSNTISGFDGMR